MSFEPFPMEDRLERIHYLAPFLLSLLSVLLFFPSLGARDFWAPGEPIYGEIVRVMFEKSDWLVPVLNGQLYADKPILYFWLALLFSNLAGGVSEWTVRLPAALGGLGLVLETYEMGKTFYDWQSGFLAGLILATTSRVLWESRFLRLDTVLAFFLLVGFYFFLKAFSHKGGKGLYLVAYACFAVATLTKGPVGLVLPGLAILSLILLTGRWRELREMHFVSGLLLVIMVLAPWLLLLHLKGEDQWIREFIWVHNVQNYALEPIGHIRPYYYYFENLPPNFLPWTLLLPGALIFYYPWKDRLREPATLAFVCWFATVFVFFSVSKSKIAYYLLPLLPTLALFAGCYLRALLSQPGPHGVHWRCTASLFYLLAAALLAGGIALPIVTYRVERGLLIWALPLTLVLVVGSSGMIVFLRQKKLQSFLFCFLAVLLGVCIISSVGVLPYMDKFKSPRPVGEFVRDRISNEATVYIFQSTMADFNYYARREEIPQLASEEEVAKVSAAGAETYLLVNNKDLPGVHLKPGQPVIMKHRVGDKTWYVVKLS